MIPITQQSCVITFAQRADAVTILPNAVIVMPERGNVAPAASPLPATSSVDGSAPMRLTTNVLATTPLAEY